MSTLSASAGQPVAPGVHRIRLPMPFRVGDVNVHLLEDDPLTLIDTGPNTIAALRALEEGLAAHTRRVEDIELVLVTHQHIDHVGLVAEIVRRSGAEVGCLEQLAGPMEDYLAFAHQDDAVIRGEMRRHGVDPAVVAAFKPFLALKRHLGSSFRADRRLRDGDIVPLAGMPLRVWHRPGHSPSDTLFYDEASRVLFGGDHLLARTSSNPLIAAPLPSLPSAAADRVRAPALIMYLESLEATRRMDVELVAAGHGDAVHDAGALIGRRIDMHRERAERILRLLIRPRTAFEVAGELWSDQALSQPHLTVSEALGHLELLVRDGTVAIEEAEDVVRFAAL